MVRQIYCCQYKGNNILGKMTHPAHTGIAVTGQLLTLQRFVSQVNFSYFRLQIIGNRKFLSL
jgi:hypothetical protein